MSVPEQVVLATGNPGKVRELRALADGSLQFVTQHELGLEAAEETGDSFLENAFLKARAAAAQSGMPAIADDSGLEVDALDGAPGVHSARYAGHDASDKDNVEKLLRALASVREGERGARFRCVMVYVRNAADPAPVVSEGTWEGSIAMIPRGEDGFGYDPVFVDRGTGSTAAELGPDDKNRRSHRGQAARGLIRQLLNAKSE